jgi:predicted Zn-dependent peptidase
VNTTSLDQSVNQTVAPNGLTVLSEQLPTVRSAAVGIWVRTASAHEHRSQMGISHLLEHMVFKGTERRSARQLALELESRGGSLDAFTGRDHTCYQAHVLDVDLPRAVDVLTDLVRRPLLRETDLSLERNVVLEEINTVEDTPDDLVFELFADRLWPQHPYGYSILGTRESVGGLSSEDLKQVHGSGYYRGNCVIAAAGRIEHERLLELLGNEGWFEDVGPEAPRGPLPGAPAVRGQTFGIERDTAQCHMVLGSDAFPYRDPRRFALALLVNAFGGGMSSRLFQRIREELGLAYAIYAFQQLFQSSGILGVYIGTQPSTAEQALEAIRQEYATLAATGLSDEELAQGKQQLKGQILLALESSISRMNRLAGTVLHGEPYRRLDEIAALIDAVALDEVRQVAAEFFAPERQTLARLGPERAA